MHGVASVQIFVLAVGAAVAGPQVYMANNVSLPVFRSLQLDALKVLRATAYTLLVEVPCRQSCSTANLKFKIKKSQNAMWRAPPDVRIHPSHNDTYSIGGLQPETLYYVRALVSPPGTYTTIEEAYTCPEQPPPVTGLRVADAGPGWLDVRWTPPVRESCASDYEYETRYKVSGGTFSPLRTYGVVPSQQKGYIRIRPSHPCPTWPKEFCLLLVDNVQPGKNHTVEVQVHRLDGKGEEKAAIQNIVGFADTHPLTSAFSPSNGTHRELSTFPNETAVRTWFIVSIVVLVLLVVFTGIILALLNSGLQWRRPRAARATPSRRASDVLPLTPSPGIPPPRRSLRLNGGREPHWAQSPHPPPYDDLEPLFTR